MRVGVIFGGRSSEHEISLMSAASVIRALCSSGKHEVLMYGIKKDGTWRRHQGTIDSIIDGSWENESSPTDICELNRTIDFAFPVLHGRYGEDGTIQGMLEMMDIPYAGCGVLASAAAMDKCIAKQIFKACGIPATRYCNFTKEDVQRAGFCDFLATSLGFPMFIKPANAGSSVGITKVTDLKHLPDALRVAVKYDRRLLAEVGVDAREIEVGVLGNSEPVASLPGEISPSAEFYNYDAKYHDPDGTRLYIPAQLDAGVVESLQELAIKAYRALDCEGYARVDFLMDKKTGEIYVGEVNTIPGFTPFSMFAKIWNATGVEYEELVERIIGYGYDRYNAKSDW